ncbi:MAG: hypothetical protein ACON5C_02425 [Alphaproteobacteria bacterium]|jgi:uncharacterized membrane protein
MNQSLDPQDNAKKTDRARTLLLIGYILMGLAWLTLFTYLIAGVMAHVQRRELVSHSFERSHWDHIWSIFIWSATWLLVLVISIFILIGLGLGPLSLIPALGFLVLLIWYYVQTIRGFLWAFYGKPFAVADENQP